jgi:2-iminobutanoate/2-iminopropanoate deaminase
MTPAVVSTPNAPAAIGPYSQAIKAGEFVFCSGQIALKPDGSLVQGTVQDETRQVLTNLDKVLEAAGSDLARVVKTTVFLRDMNDFPAMNEVYATFFKAQAPARATVAVSGLPKGVRVEIEAVALRG